ARIKHVHPHRVTYSDCQGRAADGGRAADTNAVEVWDIPTNVATPPVRVASQLDVNPRVVDANPGTKRFRALLIGGSFELPRIPCTALATQLQEALAQYGNWQGQPSPITLLTDRAATKAAVIAAIRAAQAASQPGDEFLFYYCDHGSNEGPDVAPRDEPSGHDARLFLTRASTRQVRDT